MYANRDSVQFQLGFHVGMDGVGDTIAQARPEAMASGAVAAASRMSNPMIILGGRRCEQDKQPQQRRAQQQLVQQHAAGAAVDSDSDVLALVK